MGYPNKSFHKADWQSEVPSQGLAGCNYSPVQVVAADESSLTKDVNGHSYSRKISCSVTTIPQ